MRSFLYWQIRLALRPILAPWVPIALQRAWASIAAAGTRAPPGCSSAPAMLGNVPGLRVTPANARADRVVLYFHGGGYVIGGPGSHRKLAAQIAHVARSEAWLVDYRLAPEHPHPAALEDALSAYRWLSQREGSRRIVLAGDSAGAGLAIAAAVAIRDLNLPPPAAMVLISPWTDLTLCGESQRTHHDRDPMLRRAWLAACAAHYAGELPLESAALSPLFADLTHLAPMLIQVGSEEILLSDSERLAERAKQAGVIVRLSCFEGMWHDFQVHAGMLAEANRALAEIGGFIDERMDEIE
ncbi:MAG TPA: alpha/beta hydrolase [Rudaea sp.]|nr:alpha/beta hydrolase [Rudaea sp.]